MVGHSTSGYCKANGRIELLKVFPEHINLVFCLQIVIIRIELVAEFSKLRHNKLPIFHESYEF